MQQVGSCFYYYFSVLLIMIMFRSTILGLFIVLSLTSIAVVFGLVMLVMQQQSDRFLKHSPVTFKFGDKHNVRILVWVLTGPSTHMTKALHVKRTWGTHFDKLLFMSSEADDLLGTIALEGVGEGREHLWQKTQRAFEHVWEHHKNDADWFMKVDDDTFVVNHNLREFLKNLNPNEPHYFGLKLKYPLVPIRVNYGGTGYILSKAALKLFLEALQRGGDCYKGIRKKYKGDEDSELAICLKSMNVTAENIADSKGRSQMIVVRYITNFDDVVVNFNGTWHNTQIKWSPQPISFHKVSPSQMYLLEILANTMKIF